ncbi:hypothetical protein [Streptomyces sp. NPDC048551]|uniref:hypothetical protein n=1 Tax=Streptomyces sp. NPDC048551 TaxID=3155758 RepID=UPI0034406C5D
MIYGRHHAKGAPALGALPGQDGPFGPWSNPADNDPHTSPPAELRTQTLVCPHCAAGPVGGQARTIATAGRRLTVTWHRLPCPHYTADRVLAGEED